ncbi:MAG: PAS domain-containing sensor histidine kinase [Solidesulfovibrio sp. DCME]|uniref:PAS domain-containing sensor histidine kinase n=1 Tax=Solidesulfovibrio sp. DCME TaxID=3447380 RepID=UPI003D13C26C
MTDASLPLDDPAFVASLMEASPDLFFFKDAGCVYRYVNKAFCDLFALSRDAIIGHTDFEIFPGDNAARHYRADQTVLATGRFASFEYEVVHEARAVWLQVLKTPVRDGSGRINGIFCTARNITTRKRLEVDARLARRELEKDLAEQAEDLRRVNQELRRQIIQRHKAEKALEESLRSLNLIFENSPIGISFVTDRVVRRANPHFHALFACPLSGIVGKPTSAFYPDAAAYEAFGERYYPLIARGERVDIVHPMRRCDGSTFWCRIIGQVLDPDKPQAGSVWLMEDVTERQMAEEATRAAERLKREFMDNMTHEIRTPLNGIMGMAEVLAGTELSEEQRDLVETLRHSAGNLTELLVGILDYVRLDAGGEATRNDPFHIGDIVQGAINSFGASAMQKGLALSSRIHPGVPEVVVGDGAGLRRILAALASNAVKFTDAGTVAVEVMPGHGCRPGALETPRDGAVVLSFAVRDSGIGLSAAERRSIFEPFRQVDGSMTRRFGGVGMGLAIARKVAEAMGGVLDVESEPGVGSVFCFSAPFGLLEDAEGEV